MFTKIEAIINLSLPTRDRSVRAELVVDMDGDIVIRYNNPGVAQELLLEIQKEGVLDGLVVRMEAE